MTPLVYPSFPWQPISFRTAYWLFLISLAAVVWASLSNRLGLNAESRAAADAANWHHWIDDRFDLKALLLRPAAWVAEEIIFRGFLLQWFRRHMPLWGALLMSSFLFGIEHGSKGLQTMSVAFVMGGYLGWLLVRTNSLYATIIAHVSINTAAFYIVWPLLASTGRLDGGLPEYPVWCWLLSTAVIVAGVFVLRREFRLAPPVAASQK